MTETQAKPIIRVEDVTVAYGDFVVMRDIRFEVEAGEIFAILGGSGSGKSTLLKSMIGLNKPAKGRVLIEGTDIVAAEGADLLALLRKIGVMYQNGALFGSMDLLENICLVLEEFTDLPREAMERIARMKLKVVNLDGVRVQDAVRAERRDAQESRHRPGHGPRSDDPVSRRAFRRTGSHHLRPARRVDFEALPHSADDLRRRDA
jgi:ABC-type transporter Mla maintaining outer membrane lipid asymmetry ATPase subunit MlaF